MPRRRPISGTYVRAQIPPPHEKPHEACVLVPRDPLLKPDAEEAKRYAQEVARRIRESAA